MKITEILKKSGKTLSFEVFPPKSSSSFESVQWATQEIAALSPSFMSVTYGAGGGTSKYTLEIAKTIEESYNIPTVAHLTCVSSTRETVRERIADFLDKGISNIMALRGDIPSDLVGIPRDYSHAVELVRQLRANGDFCIGGACYPEVHPESPSRDVDIAYLKEKVDAGLDFLTTQMFFDNNLYYDFLENARKNGINLPIIPGIMPITSTKQIERARSLSHSYIPPRFLAIAERYESDPLSMKQAGIEYATEQIADLFEKGVGNVHVYTMNNPEVARAIINNLSYILG